MATHHWRRAAAVAIIGVGLLSATRADAHGGGGSQPASLEAVPDSPTKQSIIKLQQSVQQAGFKPSLVAQPLGEAVGALERARGAVAAGDTRHSGLIEALAEEWVHVAQALYRAARSEAKATTLAKRAKELATKVDRAQTLLTEQQAQRGRLQAEVKRAEEQAKKAAGGAAAVETRRLQKAEKRKAKQGKKRKTGGGP